MADRRETTKNEVDYIDVLNRSFVIDVDEAEAPAAGDAASGDDGPSGPRYLVHNRTPWEIRVTDPDAGELVVAPLGQRVVLGARLAAFGPSLRRLRQLHQLRVRPNVETNLNYMTPSGLFGLAVLTQLAMLTWALVRWGTVVRLPFAIVSLGCAAAALGSIGLAIHRERDRRHRERVSDREEGDIVFGVGGEFFQGNDFTRKIWQVANLIGVVVIGAVLPAVAIYLGTELHQNVTFENGLRAVPGMDGEVISRVIQLTYLAVLALFPALMFFQFDRVRVGTLRGQWVRNIFRLDGRMRSLAGVHAEYGDRLAEASNYSTDSVRFLGGRRSPIIIATVLLALGWTLLVLRTDPVDFQAINQSEAAAERAADAADTASDLASDAAAADTELEKREAAEQAQAAAADAEDASQEVEILATGTVAPTPILGEGETATTSDENAAETATTSDENAAEAATTPTDENEGEAATTSDDAVEAAAASASAAEASASSAELSAREVAIVPFFQLLNPRPSAAAMAFLGTYFFAMFLILRGYLRGDLRPKVYNQITARLITVVIIAYLVNAFFLTNPAGSHRLIWALAFIAGLIPTTVLRHFGEFLGGRFLIGALFGKAFAEERPLTLIDGIDIYDRERLASEGVSDIEALAHNNLVSTMVSTRLPVERLVDWTDQALLILHVQPALGGMDGEQTKGRSAKLSARVRALRSAGIRTATDLLDVYDLGGEPLETIRATLAAEELDLAIVEALLRTDTSLATIEQWRNSEFAAVDSPRRYIDNTGQLCEYPSADSGNGEVIDLNTPAGAKQ